MFPDALEGPARQALKARPSCPAPGRNRCGPLDNLVEPRSPRPEVPKQLPLHFKQHIDKVKAAGKYDGTVGSLDEARQIMREAMPDALELPPAVVGEPYPSPPPAVKKWYQVQPAEPNVGNNLPHIKYADWTGGKKGNGGSWGHIFFPEPGG